MENNINYINIIKGSGFINRPIDFSNEIHIVTYMYNNNIIDSTITFQNSFRILSNDNYGIIYNIEDENIYHLTPIFTHSFIVINSNLINSNISETTYLSIINNRQQLKNEIIKEKKKKDMIKTTMMVLYKCIQINIYWN